MLKSLAVLNPSDFCHCNFKVKFRAAARKARILFWFSLYMFQTIKRKGFFGKIPINICRKAGLEIVENSRVLFNIAKSRRESFFSI